MPSILLPASKRQVQATALLLCLAAGANGFQQVKPLASGAARSTTLPGRIAELAYRDDKFAEDHVTKTRDSKPLISKEVVLELNLTEEEVEEALLNDNQKQQQLPREDREVEKTTAFPDDYKVTLEDERQLVSNAAQTKTLALSEKDIPALPSLADYRKFCLPALGLLLSGPLLSLVDTAFVGVGSTSAELAALGPATALFDVLSWTLSFLNVVTTNMYSSALAKGSQEEAEGTVRTGSRVALACGTAVMTTLIVFCKPILTAYMGPQAAATPGILTGACTYLGIRALSMPTFLLAGVLQSALLGRKDSVTPLKAIGYSTIVNVLGDYLCVNALGMGVKGAAIATTASQWVATLALLFPARRKLTEEGKLRLMNFKRKSAVSIRSFLSLAGPVLALLVGKLAAFGFLTQAAASVPGQPIPLASHQIILSLFLFLCPFVEVINQTAQAFLPAFYAPVKDHVTRMKQLNPNYNADEDTVVQKWKAASKKVSNGYLKSCLLVGATVATAGSIIPSSLGQLLTQDVAVQNALKPLAKFLWSATLLMGPMSATEGILLAANKTWFLATMYSVSTAIFPYVLLNFGSSSIASIWLSFSLFQAYRATMQTIKVTGFSPKKILSKATQIVTAPFISVQGQFA